MKKNIRKLLSVFLAFAMVLTCFIIPSVVQHTNAYEKHELKIGQGNILQLAGWSFNNITQQVRNIANSSFVTVQVSPIQVTANATAGLDSTQWKELYKPGDVYEIDNSGNSALGTKAEFIEMTSALHNYGMKVIVEVAVEADAPVQSVTAYLEECIDAGADGFKLTDPANNTGAYWSGIIADATEYAETSRGIELYVYGEFTDSADLMADIGSYKDVMCLTENLYPEQIVDALVNCVSADFIGENRKAVDGDRLVRITESLSDYMSGENSSVTDEIIRKAYALMACRLESPTVFLSRPVPGGKLGDIGGDSWSYATVKAVNDFKNDLPDFKGEELYTYGHLACVERTGKGVVVVDFMNTTDFLNMPVKTLGRGTYSDVINLSTFTVAENTGKLVGYLSSYNMSVIYQPRACYHINHDVNGSCPRCGLTVEHEYDETGVCVCGTCSHLNHNTEGRCVICGAAVEHDYGSNAVCSCGVCDPTGKKMYFKNTEGWTEVYIYSWSQGGDIQHTGSWPGKKMMQLDGDIYCYVLPSGAENVIFNNGAGVQTADLFVTESNLYTYSTDEWSVFTPDFKYVAECGALAEDLLASDHEAVIYTSYGVVKTKGAMCSGDVIVKNKDLIDEKLMTVIVKGDVDGDGKASSKDIILAKLASADSNFKVYADAADMNGNGVVEKDDMELIAELIFAD